MTALARTRKTIEQRHREAIANYAAPLSTPLPTLTKWWLAWVFITSAAAGLATLFVPTFLSSNAYRYVFDLGGGVVPVGTLWMLVALGTVHAYFSGNTVALAVVLGVHAFLQASFGLSIFVLTLDGSVGAITGSFQWWTSAVISLLLLWRQADLPH